MAENFLTKKVGPAPVWVYVGGVAGIGTYLYIRHRQNASANAASAATDTTATDATDTTPPDNLGAGGMYPPPIGGGTVDGTGSVLPPPPTTPTSSEPTGSLSLAQLRHELTAAQRVQEATKRTVNATDAAWAKVHRKVPSPQYAAYKDALRVHNRALGRVQELDAQIKKLGG